MKITLKQLQVFDAVASCGGLTKAADRLGMSQSALSCTLKDLQIILGRPLFSHAAGRALQINDEGRRLWPLARSILNETQTIEKPPSKSLEGELVVACTEMIGETLLPAICVEFGRKYPGVDISLKSLGAGEILNMFERMEIDTAVIENLPDLESVQLTPWKTDELWLVVDPAHPLAGRARLTIADLRGHDWCLGDSNSSTAIRLRVLLHETLGAIPVRHRMNSNQAIRMAVMAGGGIGCLSQHIVDRDLQEGRLARLDVADFKFTRTLNLARPPKVKRGRLAAEFDDFLLSYEGSDKSPARRPPPDEKRRSRSAG